MQEITLQELLEAGCHFGHQAKKWHPKMKPYLFDERDGIHIFDLVKTKQGLEQAGKYVQDLIKSNKTLLLVGTKRQAQSAISKAALQTGLPSVTYRWLGGTLTNWDQIQKSLKKLSDMKAARARGEYKKFTKREQLLLDREIVRLEKLFGGIASLTQPPDAIFVVDPKKEATAVREANRLKISLIALTDSNCDPGSISVIIPANDDGDKSIQLVVDYIATAIKTAQGKTGKKAEDKPQEATAEKPREAITEKPEKKIGKSMKGKLAEAREEKPAKTKKTKASKPANE